MKRVAGQHRALHLSDSYATLGHTPGSHTADDLSLGTRNARSCAESYHYRRLAACRTGKANSRELGVAVMRVQSSGIDPAIVRTGLLAVKFTVARQLVPHPCYLVPEPVTWSEWCRNCGYPVFRCTNSWWAKCVHIKTGLEPCLPDDPYVVASPIWYPAAIRLEAAAGSGTGCAPTSLQHLAARQRTEVPC
jgi:hypothetical protein